MCGILGYVGAAAERHGERGLRQRLQQMASRGPDGEGAWLGERLALGMRRLAVIDVAGGDQPFHGRDGRVVAFQNGEIYNHEPLRAELESCGYRFRSRCDTEILAHGYDAWGIDGLLRRLDGMFALAILDRDSECLHLARDRFGEKPLFWAHRGDDFAFASDLRCLLGFDFVDRSYDLLSLTRYLAVHYCPGERTMLRGVRRVLPGERLTLDLRRMQTSRESYFRPDYASHVEFSEAELADLLRRAVRSRLVADVPVGIFLSGGIDSSIVTALAVESHPDISTFSMGFDDPSRDETAQAQRVAEALGTNHHHFRFDEGSFFELLPAVVAALDEPVGDQAMLPLFWLCREARKSVTVVLSGEGADEVFGGYEYYLSPRLPRLGPRTRDGMLGDGEGAALSGFPLLTGGAERALLVPDADPEETDRWEQWAVTRTGSAATSPRKRSVADLLTWLPDDLLVKLDRMAMAHSLEGRAPYLCPELVGYGLSLPDRWRSSRPLTKKALRAMAAELLPAETVRYPKRGFVLPMRQWLTSWFAAQGDIDRYVRERAPDAMNAEAVTALIRRDLAVGVGRERLLFALVVLLEWNATLQRSTAEALDRAVTASAAAGRPRTD